MQGLIDTHAHLEQLPDLAASLARADQAGLEAVIAVGGGQQANSALLEIYQRRPWAVKIYLALGIHPGNLDNLELEGALRFILSRSKPEPFMARMGLTAQVFRLLRTPGFSPGGLH